MQFVSVFMWTVKLGKPSYSHGEPHLGHPHAQTTTRTAFSDASGAWPVPVLRLARQNVTSCDSQQWSKVNTPTHTWLGVQHVRVACALKRRACVHVSRLHAAPMTRDSPGFLFVLSLREHSDTTHESCDAAPWSFLPTWSARQIHDVASADGIELSPGVRMDCAVTERTVSNGEVHQCLKLRLDTLDVAMAGCPAMVLAAHETVEPSGARSPRIA